MKRFFIALAVLSLFAVSCDKVENPYPEVASQGDYDLYPAGDSAHYAANAWPSFSTNTNTNRNVLIEDYTGHKCNFCPPAAEEAENIRAGNPKKEPMCKIT